MIIFGSNNSLIKMKDAPRAQCSRCNEIGYLRMSRYVNYVHLFWIPTFPYGTKSLSYCDNCENMLTYEEMDKTEQVHYREFKEFARLPIWSFSGIIIILGIIAWSFVSSDLGSETTKEYALSPLQGDVCYWQKSPTTFTSIRIAKVTEDTIYVLFNDYNTNRISGIREIDLSSNYTTDTISMSRTYFKGMIDSDQIIQIKR